MLRYIINILQLLISPARGWEDVSKRGQTPDEIATRGFYPLIGLTALSSFIRLAYTHTPFKLMLPGLIEDAAITFSSFFISRFIASAIWNSKITTQLTGASTDNIRHDTFIIYSLGLLALIQLFANLLPVTHSIIEFLPLLALVEMWMGCNYVGVKKNNLVGFIIYSATTILLPPYILFQIFTMAMPHHP